ncbi:MAG: Holliday junction resolvase RuvX [Synergistaceae bacterium]|nr:Holliday junction resolvase RuvX [Synergistaceae bacterium]
MTKAQGRVLALDIGTVRVGVAVSDPGRVIAQGLDVWNVEEGWRRKLDQCIERYDPAVIVIGMPRRTDGSIGPEGQKIEALADLLRAAHPDRELVTWDERFTTVIAQRALLEGDVSRRGRRERVDKVAATLILQSWLERQGG